MGMKTIKAALVVGTAIALTAGTFGAPKGINREFSGKNPFTTITTLRGSPARQDTAKTVVLPMIVKKVGSGFCIENAIDEEGNKYALASLDIPQAILTKATQKESVEAINEKDLVGAYNVGGLKILGMRFGVIAVKDARGRHDQITDLWLATGEIKSVNVSPYGQGKDGWATITITGMDGTTEKLVMFVENGSKTLLRNFDAGTD